MNSVDWSVGNNLGDIAKALQAMAKEMKRANDREENKAAAEADKNRWV